MTWRELADQIGKEAHSAAFKESMELDKLLKASAPELLAVQVATKSAIDAAIIHFAKSHTWPNLEPQQRTMLARRLLFAENLVRGVLMARNVNGQALLPDEMPWSEGETLEFLLIDLWERYGLLELQLVS